MEKLTNTIEQTIYGYDPSEFMPIRIDGEVANWDAFVAYKAKRAVRHLGHAVAKTFEVVAEATQN